MLLPLSADIRKVIVAPLNWGLGHATRSIPIIRQLVSEGKEVVLASDGEALELLQEEFPSLETELLPPYRVSYHSASLIRIVLANAPNIFQAIIKERRLARWLCAKHNPDLIISDSRFGFRTSKVKSIIISHQLNVMSENKLLKFFLNRGNQFFLNAFDACWVPDDKEHTWSGNLSKSSKINNQVFIGPLSRLSKEPENDVMESFDLCIVLSGPEPARTNLETQLIEKLKNSTKSICLVRGTRRLKKLELLENWAVIDRADSLKINQLLLHSSKIISRSGYTSIMDYAALERSAWLVPTPGQSEQVYLATYLDGKHGMERLDLESLVLS